MLHAEKIAKQNFMTLYRAEMGFSWPEGHPIPSGTAFADETNEFIYVIRQCKTPEGKPNGFWRIDVTDYETSMFCQMGAF